MIGFEFDIVVGNEGEMRNLLGGSSIGTILINLKPFILLENARRYFHDGFGKNIGNFQPIANST